MSEADKDRFLKLVHTTMNEMDAEIVALETEVTQLKSKLRKVSFHNDQSTQCGKCGQFKHTPWRSDQFGYVCVSCLLDLKDTEIKGLKDLLQESHKHTVPGCCPCCGEAGDPADGGFLHCTNPQCGVNLYSNTKKGT